MLNETFTWSWSRITVYQLKEFTEYIKYVESKIGKVKYKHCANSAATILFKKTYFNFVRPGISAYGMWASKETMLSAIRENKRIILKPAMTWKSVVAQVKIVEKGAYIGYGCTYRATHRMNIAIIPVGYYDGYVRLLSGKGYVLISGERAPLVGRVCMNIIMVDISHITGVGLEDEVILLGRSTGTTSAGKREEEITAEQIAEWSYTINYEVTTRINDRIPRVLK